jgi:hypothetical protein
MNARGAFPQRLAVDHEQISRFVDALFRYADAGTVVSMRAFQDGADGTWAATEWPAVRVNGVRLDHVADAAAAFAEKCAAAPIPVVFAPPIATFRTENSAAEKDVANGLVLTVECDKDAPKARALLETLIGTATLVVASGGQWVDPDTSEITPKLHLHWRLKEPTRSFADHQKLKQARLLAQRLVGSDATAVPLVHPIRWPGSWHRKAEPRLAKIVGGDVNAEIELADAYERLCESTAAMGREKPANQVRSSSRPQADEFDVIAALQAIPNNDVTWDEWNRIGLAACGRPAGRKLGLPLLRHGRPNRPKTNLLPRANAGIISRNRRPAKSVPARCSFSPSRRVPVGGNRPLRSTPPEQPTNGWSPTWRCCGFIVASHLNCH